MIGLELSYGGMEFLWFGFYGQDVSVVLFQAEFIGCLVVEEYVISFLEIVICGGKYKIITCLIGLNNSLIDKFREQIFHLVDKHNSGTKVITQGYSHIVLIQGIAGKTVSSLIQIQFLMVGPV